MEVKVLENDVERALRAFKRQFQKEGLFREIKKRRFYEKPSEKKRRKQREGAKKRAAARRYNRNPGN